jgi:TrmH family RNA methyltransferase
LRSELVIEAVIYSDQIARKVKVARLIEELSHACDRLASVSEKLLESISYTRTPQGIVLLAARPRMNEATFKSSQAGSPLLVVLHGINNPVNVGAILRTAEAAGVTGAITTQRTSDPYSPKGLRGAMGSAFRVPILTDTTYAEVLSWCAERRIKTICTAVGGPKLYTDVDWKGPSALIVGPEATGLSSEEVAATNLAIRIPMHGQVESLNAAVAAAIVLYEAARQRASIKESIKLV